MSDLDHFIANTLQDDHGYTREEAYEASYRYTLTKAPVNVTTAPTADLEKAVQGTLLQASIDRHPSGKSLTPAVPGSGANIIHFPGHSHSR